MPTQEQLDRQAEKNPNLTAELEHFLGALIEGETVAVVVPRLDFIVDRTPRGDGTFAYVEISGMDLGLQIVGLVKLNSNLLKELEVARRANKHLGKELEKNARRGSKLARALRRQRKGG